MYCFAISDVDDQRGPGRQFTHFITNSNDIVIHSLNATIISYIGVRVFLVFDITECSGLWEVCGMKNYQNIFGFGPPPHTHARLSLTRFWINPCFLRHVSYKSDVGESLKLILVRVLSLITKPRQSIIAKTLLIVCEIPPECEKAVCQDKNHCCLFYPI